MSIRANLIAARPLVANPETWGQGEYAYDENRQPVSSLDPRAVCFCSLGALENTLSNRRVTTEEKQALRDAARALFGPTYSTIRVNDELGHEATLKMWDHAIEHAPN